MIMQQHEDLSESDLDTVIANSENLFKRGFYKSFKSYKLSAIDIIVY